MVVAAKNILLHLCVISNFILIGNKGLAHAQNCLKSAKTVQVVKNCPENQREWEEAAQRKNCLVIQKYDNCSKVEYHCLVNEFRNETIEVCTSPKYLQGYCPHYYLNEAKNDYTKECVEYSYPCNCSSRYLSTEAYKLKCCFNGTNGDSREIQIDTNSDKNSNGLLGLWIVLGIVGLVGIVFLACVIYGIKRQNKPLCEALQIWRNISCKSPICACLSSDCRQDQNERVPGVLTETSTFNSIEQNKETKPMLKKDDEKDNLNAETAVAQASEEDTSKLEMSAVVLTEGGNSMFEKPASHTLDTNSSNSGISEVDGPKPKAIVSQTPYKDILNSGASLLRAPDSNGKSVTETDAPIRHPSDNDYEAKGLCHNLMTKYDDPLNAGNKIMTPVKELTLFDRKKCVKKLKNDLERKVFYYFGGDGHRLEYKLKSIKQKIINRKSCGNLHMSTFKMDEIEDKHKSLEEKAKTLEEYLQKMNEKADANIKLWTNAEFEGQFASCIDNPLLQESTVKENEEKFEDNLAESNVLNLEGNASGDDEHGDDDNTKRMEGHIRMPCSQPAISSKQSKKIWSDGKGARENISVSEKVDKLKMSFETWWAGLKLHAFRRLEQDLLDIEVDTIIINYLFAFNISALNDKIENSHQKALSKQGIQEAFEEIKVTFDELKEENEVF
ncbi:uncharacterized protein [Magallana gigas]|uniref:uncharacterized protein isoform X3 n=1 Tax=Magallana gigas TaxID=29159 RepID=UPI00334168B0